MHRKKRLNTYINKSVAALGVMAILMGSIGIHRERVYGADTLFELKNEQIITKGVKYEKSRRITNEGFLDIHVLKMPLFDTNISIGSATSTKESGLKEAVTNLLAERDAVAGVNGDFFTIQGDYSYPFGPVVRDGKVLYLSDEYNRKGNEYAMLYIDQNGDPFIDFVSTEITFRNNGELNVNVEAVNKISDMKDAVILNTLAMKDTKSVDSRFDKIIKIVVTDDKITYISKPGESVNIPENGYALLLGKADAEKAQLFAVGQSAEFTISSKVDYTKLKTAFGGAGSILENGKPAKEGIVIDGRNPRTAIGINQDKTQLILMVVDGRSHSIGATHDEMIKLMQEYSAYNAMHMDGGGSSTMAFKAPGANEYTLANTVSGGTQRKVISAVGIYNDAPIGTVSRISIKPDADVAFVGAPMKVRAYGLDEYYRNIDASIKVTTDDPAGIKDGGVFVPSKEGKTNIKATYGGLSELYQINVTKLAQLDAADKHINILEGQSYELNVIGTGTDGNSGAIKTGITYQVIPSQMGRMSGNTFEANESGNGYILFNYGGINGCVPVKVGGRNEKLTLDAKTIEKAISIPADAYAIKLNVNGDASGYVLKGSISDADGKAYTMTFAKTIDWAGGKEVSAFIPEAAKRPVTLKKIYADPVDIRGAEQTIPTVSAAWVVYPYTEDVKLPTVPRFTDNLNLKNGGIAPEAASNVEMNLGRLITTFSKERKENLLVLNVPSYAGGFLNTKTDTWSRLSSEVNKAKEKNIVIVTDVDPFTFTQAREFGLFHEMLAEFQKRGKNIFVMSVRTNDLKLDKAATTDVRNGVRYINMGNSRMSDRNNKVLLQVGSTKMTYDLK